MNKQTEIYNFLIEEFGFVKIEDEYFSSFGNFNIVLTSLKFTVRYISDRSFVSIDIRGNAKQSEWYDLALVKALVHQEKILDKPTQIEMLNYFLKTEFNLIADLFNIENYLDTQIKLNYLQKLRIKQMFPPRYP